MSSPTSLVTVSRNVSGLRLRLACGRRQGSMVQMVCPQPLYNGLQSEHCVERVQMQWDEGLHIFSGGLDVSSSGI